MSQEHSKVKTVKLSQREEKNRVYCFGSTIQKQRTYSSCICREEPKKGSTLGILELAICLDIESLRLIKQSLNVINLLYILSFLFWRRKGRLKTCIIREPLGIRLPNTLLIGIWIDKLQTLYRGEYHATG